MEVKLNKKRLTQLVGFLLEVTSTIDASKEHFVALAIDYLTGDGDASPVATDMQPKLTHKEKKEITSRFCELTKQVKPLMEEILPLAETLNGFNFSHNDRDRLREQLDRDMLREQLGNWEMYETTNLLADLIHCGLIGFADRFQSIDSDLATADEQTKLTRKEKKEVASQFSELKKQVKPLMEEMLLFAKTLNGSSFSQNDRAKLRVQLGNWEKGETTILLNNLIRLCSRSCHEIYASKIHDPFADQN